MTATDYEIPSNVRHMVPVGWHTASGSAQYSGGYVVENTGEGWAIAIKGSGYGVTDIHVAICDDEHTARLICALLNADQQRGS